MMSNGWDEVELRLEEEAEFGWGWGLGVWNNLSLLHTIRRGGS